MHIRLAAILALSSSSAMAAAPNALPVYNGQPLASWQIQVSDFETNKTLEGDKVEIAKQAKVPESVVSVARTAKAGKNDALTLDFNKAWYAALRVDGGQPVDLRPYLDKGVLALDVNVQELDKGGMSFKLMCGERCGRSVPYLVPGREMAGKGWQHLVFSLRCFYREGDDFSAVTQPFALEASGSGKISVANVQYQMSGKPNASCPDYKTMSVTPDKLNESWSIDWWTKRHEDKLAEARQLGKSAQLVFIGDSITHNWEKDGAPVWNRVYKPLNALDLGFGGDRTENVLWRLQHGEVDGLAPKVAVLMFGTNNTGHRQEDPKTTALGIRRNIEELRKRLPDTKILLLAIFPRGEKPDDPMRQLNDKVNAIIAGYADDQQVFFLDIGKAFLQPDGTLSRDIMPDLLHPNERGYEIWAKAMAPTLRKLLPEAGQYAWDNVAIGGSGFVSGLIASKTEPGLIYARTDVGGAYRWDVKKKRWIPLMDWVSDKDTGLLGIESLAIDPSSPNKLYMTAGIAYLNGGASAVLKSDDYGQTFQRIDVTRQFKVHGNGMGRGNGEKLQVDPANGKILYAGTRANGLFRSTDEGLTWHRLDGLDVTTTNNGNGISLVLLDRGRIYVGVSRFGENMYMSADGGKTFRAMAGGPDKLMPHRAVIAGGKLVVTFAKGAGPHADKARDEGLEEGGVWQYDIASGKWTDISPPLNAAYAGITVDPRNPQRLVVSTISHYDMRGGIGDQFYETLDGGKHWQSIVANGVQIDANGVSWIAGSFIHWTASIEFDPFDSQRLMAVSGNGVFVSTDIHAAKPVWKFEDIGLEESVPLNLVSIPGGPVISAIGDYDGFRHTDVTQYAPIHTPTMGTTWGLDYAARNPNVVVRAGKAMYISKDMGVTWTRTATTRGEQGQVALSADGKVIVHCPEKSTTCYRSGDDGASWSAVQGLHIERGRAVADPLDARRFYALAGDRLLVSTDGGASFAPAAATLASARGAKAIRVMPGRSGDVWVALYDGGLARSTDAGASFATLPVVSYAAAVGFGKAAPGAADPTVYIWGEVGGVRGVFRSTDSGASWMRVNDDQHQYGGPGDAQFVVGDMNTFGVVYMSTAGRGIVYGKPKNIIP